jgi:renal tumor antigen
MVDVGKLALVFELMEMNLYECLKNKRKPLTMHKIKYYMFQVLKAIDFMHRKNIFHRDIKPENILVTDDLVKVADLGSCKGTVYSNVGRHSQQPYTEYISTRWYRAPECLMTDGYYNEKMDIWGFGCVLYELITKVPLFAGRDELDQVNRIHNVLGTHKPEIL